MTLNRLPLICISLISLSILSACDKAAETAGKALDASRNVTTGKGGSVATGSAGPAGTEGE